MSPTSDLSDTVFIPNRNVNQHPFATHAPPLDQPGNFAEQLYFDDPVLEWPTGLLPPRRMSVRLYNQRGRDDFPDPDFYPWRVCIDCHGQIMRVQDNPSDFPGRCRTCWRFLNPPPVPVPRHPDNRMCYCSCRCPPAQNHPINSDSDDSQDSNFSDSTQTAHTLNPDRPIARGVFPRSGDVSRASRNYMPEPADHHRAGIVRRISEPELAHTVNAHNTVDAEQELPPLQRFIGQAEIAHFLSEGWTRDQIRDRFPETRDPFFENYLPPDLSPVFPRARLLQIPYTRLTFTAFEFDDLDERRRPLWPTEHCGHCHLPFSQKTMRAIYRYDRIRALRSGARQHEADGDFDIASDCLNEADRLERFMVTKRCSSCYTTIPVQGLHADNISGNCYCLCNCGADTLSGPSSADSSRSGRLG